MSHWLRLAWIIWAVLVTLAVGRAALHHLPRHQGCYDVFADGGRHWLAGADLYDRDYPDSLTVFRYSPLTAVLLVPLALVPDPVGSALLRAAGVGLFLFGLLWWARACWPRDPSGRQRGLFLLLVAGMVTSAVMDVQLNLLTIGFLLVGVAAAAEERWNTSALAVSLAVCLKAYPLSLALVLALVFPRRFAGRWLLTMALCLGLPFLLQSPDYVLNQYADWLRWGLNQRRGYAAQGIFHDLMLLCYRWLVPISPEVYAALEVDAGILIALAAWKCRHLPGKELLTCVFGMCCAWMMVLGPSTEAVTYVLLAPAVASAVVTAWAARGWPWYRAAVTACCLLLVLAQAQLLLPLGRPLHYWGAQPFAALLFLVTVAAHGLGRRRELVNDDRDGLPRRREVRAARCGEPELHGPAARGGQGPHERPVVHDGPAPAGESQGPHGGPALPGEPQGPHGVPLGQHNESPARRAAPGPRSAA